MPMNEMNPEVNLLEDINAEWQAEDASVGQRFANYLIDIVCFYIFVFLSSMVAAVLVPAFAQYLAYGEGLSAIVDRILALILYGLFMALVEGIFKGRTLGKAITGTKAIRDNGEKLSWPLAFLRGLCRMVPFEAFSAFGGRPWHDRWTRTRVIKVRK